MNILWIDACAREDSRTRRLAAHLIERLPGTVTQLKLYEENLPRMDEAAVNQRTADAKRGDFSDPMFRYAKQFAAADCIVIAAPYWDLSFPALLKQYVEAICVTGVTFSYSAEGIPIGHCRAKKLYYVTTAGGVIFDESFGYGYLRTLAAGMFGISDTHCFKAEKLDIWGNDPEAILRESMEGITGFFEEK